MKHVTLTRRAMIRSLASTAAAAVAIGPAAALAQQLGEGMDRSGTPVIRSTRSGQ